MAQKWSTHYVPPPVSQLLNYQIDDDVNIEEGLCKPNDENLFLISSIAFLQKQLMRKLEQSQQEEKDNVMKRKYSDLLLVESGLKSKRKKYFIRLPNIEKFDEVLRSEACIPSKTLSNTQILPLPKTRPRKLIISNIFKHKPTSSSLIQNPNTKSSYSLFNIFKKSSPSSCNIPSNNVNFSDLSASESTSEMLPDDYLPMTESDRRFINSTFSINTLSVVRASAASTLVRKYRETDISLPSTSACDIHNSDLCLKSLTCISNNLDQSRKLNAVEEEILKVIPSGTNIALKQSIHEKLCTTRKVKTEENKTQCNDFVIQDDDFYEDPETGIKFKCVPKLPPKLKTSRVREQQSKLSVCIEEETESEMDGYVNRNYTYNCTDDVKALASCETIDILMRELLINTVDENYN